MVLIIFSRTLFSALLLSFVCLKAQNVVAVDRSCSRGYFGSRDFGILQSHNYPFNYASNLNCTYNIYVDQSNSNAKGGETYLCFTFKRFQLEDGNDGNLYDYLRLEDEHGQQYFYQGLGDRWNVEKNGDGEDERGSVWDENFCWKVTTGIYSIVMFSDDLINGRGFYATFSFATLPRRDAALPVDYAPCTDREEWTCFDRQCINSSLTCNNLYDCNDRTDEMYEHARCLSGPYSPSWSACDFQGGNECQLDGLGQGWTLASDSSHGVNGPSADHTTGSSTEGVYVRSDFDRSTRDVVLKADYMRLERDKDYCFSFWYYMSGTDVGPLSLVLYGNEDRIVWTRHGDYGQRWLHGEASIPRVDSDEVRELYFKATKSGDVTSHHALDDFYLYEKLCHAGEDVSCTFELDFCQWKAEWWTRRHPSHDTDPNYYPSRDFTTNTTGGYYVMIEDGGETQHAIQSPVISYQSNPISYAQNCFVFSYWFNGLSITRASPHGHFNVYTVHNDGLRQLQLSKEPLVRESTWTQTSVEFAENQPFELLVEFTVEGSDDILALDDLLILPGRCDELNLGSCSPGEFRCVDSGECISEDLVCDWTAHCSDGSDERLESCCYKANCRADEFCCMNGPKCVPLHSKCNGHNDCGDWSDEEDCYGECLAYLCSGGRCVSNLCDNVPDCPDGADEVHCFNPVSRAVTIGIILTSLLVLLLTVAKISLMMRRRQSSSSSSGNCLTRPRTSSTEDITQDATGADFDPFSNSDFDEAPPTYSEAINHRNNCYVNRALATSVVDQPPAYHSIVVERQQMANIAATGSSLTTGLEAPPPSSHSLLPAYEHVERRWPANHQCQSQPPTSGPNAPLPVISAITVAGFGQLGEQASSGHRSFLTVLPPYDRRKSGGADIADSQRSGEYDRAADHLMVERRPSVDNSDQGQAATNNIAANQIIGISPEADTDTLNGHKDLEMPLNPKTSQDTIVVIRQPAREEREEEVGTSEQLTVDKQPKRETNV